MHDLHTSDRILKIALERGKQNHFHIIKKISIELGTIIEHGEDLNAENLEFNIRLLAKGTIAENTIISITKNSQFNGWKLIEIEGF